MLYPIFVEIYDNQSNISMFIIINHNILYVYKSGIIIKIE